MKVKASKKLITYIPGNLGISKKEKYDLISGAELEIKDDIVKKHPHAFIVQKAKKEVKKNGNN